MGERTHTASKYTFDTEFGTDNGRAVETARQRKSYTLEEIDSLRAEARAEGLNDGEVQAAERIAEAVAALDQTLRQALGASRDEIETVRGEAARIALAAARKLARAALETHPAGDVEEALREAIHQAIGEPRIALRASPPVIAALSEKLDGIAREEGYEGRILASADPACAVSDCRIEWRGGGAERSIDAIEAAIEAVVARRFSSKQSVTSTKG
jgi:flagellar assembly protein FliH